MMSSKPLIFISHITEEKEFAIILSNFIKKSYLEMFETFVSSDGGCILSGQRWFESIDKALNQCKIQISLCSPYSIHRSWINFEAGASWIRKIPVIPICHLGLKKEELPIPLSLLQAIDIDQEDAMYRFFNTLSQELKSGIPSIDIKSFISLYKESSLNYLFKFKILNPLKKCVKYVLICLKLFIMGKKRLISFLIHYISFILKNN